MSGPCLVTRVKNKVVVNSHDLLSLVIVESITLHWCIILENSKSEKNEIDEMNVTDLADKSEHVASDIALGKPGPSVCEEVLPLSLERRVLVNIPKRRVIFNDKILRQIGFQAPSPFSKRAGIV